MGNGRKVEKVVNISKESLEILQEIVNQNSMIVECLCNPLLQVEPFDMDKAVRSNKDG